MESSMTLRTALPVGSVRMPSCNAAGLTCRKSRSPGMLLVGTAIRALLREIEQFGCTLASGEPLQGKHFFWILGGKTERGDAHQSVPANVKEENCSCVFRTLPVAPM